MLPATLDAHGMLAKMVARIKQKAKECTNPTADEEKDAMSFIVAKHRALVNSSFGLNGFVHEMLR